MWCDCAAHTRVALHRYRGFNGSLMEVPHKSGQRSYVVSGIITQVGSARVGQQNGLFHSFLNLASPDIHPCARPQSLETDSSVWLCTDRAQHRRDHRAAPPQVDPGLQGVPGGADEAAGKGACHWNTPCLWLVTICMQQAVTLQAPASEHQHGRVGFAPTY